MKPSRSPARARAAYTLLELLVGVTTASAIFAIILTSGIAIYRSCTAAGDFSDQTNQQQRAIDYVSRDLHSAVSVTTLIPGTLSMTLPDCYTAYDDGGMPLGPPTDPVIINGVPTYGDAAQPVSVNYFVNDHALIREQTVPASALTVRLVVASGVSAMEVSIDPLSTVVKFTIVFQARSHQGVTALRPGSRTTATVAARMLRMK